jgi:hypothetical protein
MIATRASFPVIKPPNRPSCRDHGLLRTLAEAAAVAVSFEPYPYRVMSVHHS